MTRITPLNWKLNYVNHYWRTPIKLECRYSDVLQIYVSVFFSNKTVVILFSRSIRTNVIHVDVCLFCTAACKMGFIRKCNIHHHLLRKIRIGDLVLLYHKRLADLIRVCSYNTCSLCQHVIYIHTCTFIHAIHYFGSKIDADLYI